MEVHNIIRKLVEKYPEMTWLTGRVETTPEASVQQGDKQTIGQSFFPHLDKKDVVEFDRTVVGILALHWVINGDYESFTACQNGPAKLTAESFKLLKEYTESILSSPEDIEAMETFMVINDLGKVSSIVKTIRQKTGIGNVDHDKILLVGLQQHPEISPSFNMLSGHHQEIIINGLSTQFNIGQYIQAENVPASLDGLVGISDENLKFYLLHALYDIAGAAGQFVQNGSVVMNEPTYKNFRLALSSLELISKGLSVSDAYDDYLAQKGAGYGLRERVITRICCMLRVTDKEQAQEISEIFSELPENTKAILEEDLNTRGTNDGIATLIYYAPAFLINLQKKLGENGVSFEDALSLGLTIFARIFQEARITNKGKTGNGIYTVMASSLAKIATEDPGKLTTHDIILKTVGDDAEAELVETKWIDQSKFTRIGSLAEIHGERIVTIGIGGGSDCMQAALLAELLKKSGKDCPAIISIRTDKTGSQSTTGMIGVKRLVENHGGEVAQGAYLITSETTGSGRFLEHIPAGDIPVYLVIEQAGIELSEQIQCVLELLGTIDTVIAVDTGGDALYSTTGHDQTKATPDQDLRSLQTISGLSGVEALSCEIAIGIDTPPNGECVLLNSGAIYFEPSSDEADWILQKYQEWEMDGINESRFGKTPLAWQQALKGNFGFQEVGLPERVVLDQNNPWNPFVYIQHSTKGMFFMEVKNHLASIGK